MIEFWTEIELMKVLVSISFSLIDWDMLIMRFDEMMKVCNSNLTLKLRRKKKIREKNISGYHFQNVHGQLFRIKLIRIL